MELFLINKTNKPELHYKMGVTVNFIIKIVLVIFCLTLFYNFCNKDISAVRQACNISSSKFSELKIIIIKKKYIKMNKL